MVKHMLIRIHILLNGEVQGVFFRSEMRDEAEKRSVTGWVRNLRDGRVEAVFEGEEAKVKEIVAYCRTGPKRAKVTNLNVAWEVYTGKFDRFEVKH